MKREETGTNRKGSDPHSPTQHKTTGEPETRCAGAQLHSHEADDQSLALELRGNLVNGTLHPAGYTTSVYTLPLKAGEQLFPCF